MLCIYYFLRKRKKPLGQPDTILTTNSYVYIIFSKYTTLTCFYKNTNLQKYNIILLTYTRPQKVVKI